MTNETKHTPGPWIVHEKDGEDKWSGVYSSDDEGLIIVADVAEVDDAHLIAAAPELLECLESAIQNMLHLRATEDWAQIIRYRAVIAKARGE